MENQNEKSSKLSIWAWIGIIIFFIRLIMWGLEKNREDDRMSQLEYDKTLKAMLGYDFPEYNRIDYLSEDSTGTHHLYYVDSKDSLYAQVIGASLKGLGVFISGNMEQKILMQKDTLFGERISLKFLSPDSSRTNLLKIPIETLFHTLNQNEKIVSSIAICEGRRSFDTVVYSVK